MHGFEYRLDMISDVIPLLNTGDTYKVLGSLLTMLLDGQPGDYENERPAQIGLLRSDLAIKEALPKPEGQVIP